MENNNIQAEFTVSRDCSCGDFLKSMGVSRRLVSKLKRTAGGIERNGQPVRTCDTLLAGDVISLKAFDADRLEPNPALKVPTVYEDSDVIVFDKPAGMPVHPSAKHRSDSLGNCFAAMFPEMTFRPINRLDKDTSGLCAVAKSVYAAGKLNGNISKIYTAAVEGMPVPCGSDNPCIKWYADGSEYVIDAPIARERESIIKRVVRSDGRKAVTRYTILNSTETHSLVRVRLETGRTHQIRVHFSAVGHPLAGDDLYGGSLDRCKVQALHCSGMKFLLPKTGKAIELYSEIRADMAELFGKRLQNGYKGN